MSHKRLGGVQSWKDFAKTIVGGLFSEDMMRTKIAMTLGKKEQKVRDTYVINQSIGNSISLGKK